MTTLIALVLLYTFSVGKGHSIHFDPIEVSFSAQLFRPTHAYTRSPLRLFLSLFRFVVMVASPFVLYFIAFTIFDAGAGDIPHGEPSAAGN